MERWSRMWLPIKNTSCKVVILLVHTEDIRGHGGDFLVVGWWLDVLCGQVGWNVHLHRACVFVGKPLVCGTQAISRNNAMHTDKATCDGLNWVGLDHEGDGMYPVRCVPVCKWNGGKSNRAQHTAHTLPLYEQYFLFRMVRSIRRWIVRLMARTKWHVSCVPLFAWWLDRKRGTCILTLFIIRVAMDLASSSFFSVWRMWAATAMVCRLFIGRGMFSVDK